MSKFQPDIIEEYRLDKISGAQFPPKVYIAGPITLGNSFHHMRTAIKAAEYFLQNGLQPYVPHLNLVWQMCIDTQRHEDEWLRYDFEWLRVCDALYRFPGESYGADKEVEIAGYWQIPVFTDPLKLVAHFNSLHGRVTK